MLPILRNRFRSKRFPKYCICHKTNSKPYTKKLFETKETSLKSANLGKVKQDGTTGRFFKNIEVIKVDDHYEIELDGFTMMSRGDRRIQFPNADLAMAVAADWDYFDEKIDPKRMHLYTLASMATDFKPELREATNESVLSFMDSDSLLIRSKENIAFEYTQMNYHDPLIEWFNKTFNMDVTTSESYFHEPPKEALYLTKIILDRLDPWTYVAFTNLVESSLSVILPLALWHREISIENAVKVITAETDSFHDRYGEVEGSSDIKKQSLLVDIASTTLFLHLLNTPPPILRKKKQE